MRRTEDVIDSRDVIARIEYLEGLPACVHCGEIIDYDAGSKTWELHDGDEPHVCTAGGAHEPDADGEELASLVDLAEEAGGYSSDWIYGATLVRDSYFKEFAQQEAEDLGLIKSDAQWPYTCIDWDDAARDLQTDYTSVDFAGVTYWIR